MPKFSAYMRGEGVKGDTGKNAGFGIISATSHVSNFPEVSISTSGSDDQKNINFDFGLVAGPAGGFSTNQNANIEFTEVGSLPSVSITTDDTSPNNSKVFNFDFKIPESKSISKIQQTKLSTTSEGENEITISYNDNSTTTFIIHNGAQGSPSFIQGAVSTTSELPNNNNYTGQAFLVGESEENKKLYVYLENEWKYQGTISGAGFGEPTSSIEIVSFTTSQIYMGDILSLEKTEKNNLEIENAKIYLQPVQDLHGYANPWPAGGGNNQFPLTVANIKSANSSSWDWANDEHEYNGVTWKILTDAVSGDIIGISTSGTSFITSTIDVYNGTLKAGSYIYNTSYTEAQNSKDSYILVGGSVVARGVSGSQSFTLAEDSTITIRLRIASGTNSSGVIFKPMIRLASVTDATFAPYSNICPISGHSTATVTRTGKNLYPDTLDMLEQGSIKGDSGADSTASNRVRTSMIPFAYDRIIDAGYKLTIPTGYKVAFRFWTASMQYVYINGNAAGFLVNLRPDYFYGHDIAYARFVYAKADDSDVTPSQMANVGFQLELGSTASAYEPYQGTSVTIDLDGTRYGGTVDVTNGVLTVDRAMVTFDGSSDEQWVRNSISSYDGYRYQITGALVGAKLPSSGRKQVDCNIGYYSSFASAVGVIFYTKNNNNIDVLYYYPPSNITEVSEFRTWLATNNMQLVYELTTPITVQLTSAQLSLLLGQNNIWADTGILELDCSKIAEPEIIVSVDPESPESAKIFNFDFKLPQGKPGEKGDTPIIGVSTSVTTLAHDVEPTVSITTLNENEFRFDFGIPVGYTPEMTATISTTDLPSGSTASATVSVEQNNLNFQFGIPQGLKGETGASINSFTFLSTNPETHGNIYYANFTDGTSTLFEVPEGPVGYGYYQKLPFTSTNIEGSNQYTWIEENNGSSTLIIDRTENDFIPVNIYNSINNNIAATFTLAASTQNYPFGTIQYNTNQKFDGILYYIGKAPVPEFRIGSVTTSSDGIASVSTSKNGYDTVLNFSFPLKGDKGDTGEKGADGNGIASIQVLSVEGLTTNYRITFTDQTMTPFDFSVRNGKNGSGSGGGIDEVDLSDDSIITNILPIEHGGTGASTSIQAWINLGGGESGKHPEGYYLTSTDVIVPTLDFTDTITSISTESYAGTSTYVARGDHTHGISLTTGDENGQVKIAGVNIDVKGLQSAAYSATTNYYPSTGGNIPTISVGGGEKIDKISITNVDPGVGSELASNNILFVYTGGGGYTYCPDNACYDGSILENNCYNSPCYGSCYNEGCSNNNCYTACYDSNCYGNCYTEQTEGTARIRYNNTYIINSDGNLVRYANEDELLTVIGTTTINRQSYEWEGTQYPSGVGFYYQIGENEYILVGATDTTYTCPSNYIANCSENTNCYSDPCYGECYTNLPCQVNECYNTVCPTDGCYVGTPCPGNGCDLSGCSGYTNCYTGDCYSTPSCPSDEFYCNVFKEMNDSTCGDYDGNGCGDFHWGEDPYHSCNDYYCPAYYY